LKSTQNNGKVNGMKNRQQLNGITPCHRLFLQPRYE